MADVIQDYSPQRFEVAKASGKTVLLAFHTSWCPICLRQKRVLDKLSATSPNLIILRVDYDGDKGTDRAFGVAMQSTLIVFKGGRETRRQTGEFHEAAINQLIA
jgi:thioredoxin 1